MRLLKIMVSAMLILSGIFCFVNQGATFGTMAFPLGVVMLLYGVSSAFSSFLAEKREGVFSVLFTEGLMAALLSVLVLSDQLATDGEILTFFGLWSLMTGVLRISEFLALGQRNPQWRWGLGQGAGCILAGFAALISPISGGLPVALMVGIIFVLQGINGLLSGIRLPMVSTRKRAEA